MAAYDPEAIAVALYNLGKSAKKPNGTDAAFGFSSRKLVLWGDDDRSHRPSLYMAQRVTPVKGAERPVPGIKTMNFSFFIYTDAKNATDDNPGSTILNAPILALWNALQPKGADIMTQRQTLGGLVNNAYVDGDIFFDPGDIDGDGMAIIPVKVLVP